MRNKFVSILNAIQISGLNPFPIANRTLCCLSFSLGGWLRRYRHSSPMYWNTVALYFRQSSQNVVAENFLARMTVAPVRKDMDITMIAGGAVCEVRLFSLRMVSVVCN